MAVLHVHLQEGFANDSVRIRVGGREVFAKDGVTTKLLLGYADTLDVQVVEGLVNVEVVVSSRNISTTIPLQVARATYLGISIEHGTIEHLISDQPFGYG